MTVNPTPTRNLWERNDGDARATLRYYDRHFQRDAVKLLPGEYYTTDEDVALVTILGSCVAACIHDPEVGVGGMNHFMLPGMETEGLASASARYGSYAMELLVNDLLKRGARRERLEAKIFGGGQVLPGFSSNHVGARNVKFVRHYLATERIFVAAEDLGDIYARKICFLPHSGQAFMRRIETASASADLASESAYSKRLRAQPDHGDVELFQ
jgi:chemotaxis protein CheD